MNLLKTMDKKLKLFLSHMISAPLLKHPFAIPKLLYLLCTSPCFLTPEVLLQYDGQLREMLRMLTSQVMTNDPSGSADGVLQ